MDDSLATAAARCSPARLKDKYRRVLMEGAPGVSLVYSPATSRRSLARVAAPDHT